MKNNLLLLLFLPFITLAAAEYFIHPAGSDVRSGLTPEQSLATLRRAAELAVPGDTLTLLPGVYHQELAWTFDGGDATTTIRAAIPGSVLLHGDLPLTNFEAVPQRERVWRCRFDKEAQTVLERDANTPYASSPTIDELALQPGSWLQEKEWLYLHTSDSRPPAGHRLTAAVLKGDAIRIIPSTNDKRVRNVTITGIAATGYASRTPDRGNRVDLNYGGVHIRRPENCRVADCAVYLAGGGITFRDAVSSRIERCFTHGNGNPHNSSGGNIIIYTPAVNCAILNSVSFDSPVNGIRYYGHNPAKDSLLENCIVFGSSKGDLWVKYPSDTTIPRRCFAQGMLEARRIENSVFGRATTLVKSSSDSNIRISAPADLEREFADPSKFDFRLQGDSKFRAADAGWGFDANVLYVAPNGNDANDGKSVRAPLQSFAAALTRLKEGGTLYLLPGEHALPLVIRGAKKLTIRGRGNRPAVLKAQAVIENSEGITCEGVIFEGGLATDGSRNFRLMNSVVVPPVKFSGPGTRLTHNIFRSGVEVAGEETFVRDNLFAAELRGTAKFSGFNAFAGVVPADEVASFTALPRFTHGHALENYADFDGRAWDGLPVGNYRRTAVFGEVEAGTAVPVSFDATTANFRVETPVPSDAILLINGKRAAQSPRGQRHSLSVGNLEPGKKYSAQIKLQLRPEPRYSSAALPGTETRNLTTPAYAFTTPAANPKGTVWHVATSGDDDAAGNSRETAFRSIGRAARCAKAGDTVLVYAGVYPETVRVDNTGAKGRPLTFRAAPGEKVWLDGAENRLDAAFEITGKSHIILDGFRFRNYGGNRGALTLRNSADILVRRCLYDGRGRFFQTRFIHASTTARLTVENSVIYRAFVGAVFYRCPGLVIQNSVIIQNQVYHFYIDARPEESVTLKNNIFTDNDLQKALNPMAIVTDAAAIREEGNCYLTRLPAAHKPIFGVSSNDGKTLPELPMEMAKVGNWQRARHARQQLPYDEFCRRFDRKASSIFADPGMAALPDYVTYRDLDEWSRVGVYEKTVDQETQKQRTENNRRHALYELNRLPGGIYRELDFADFFATTPEVVKRGIGLQPKAFEKDLQ